MSGSVPPSPDAEKPERPRSVEAPVSRSRPAEPAFDTRPIPIGRVPAGSEADLDGDARPDARGHEDPVIGSSAPPDSAGPARPIATEPPPEILIPRRPAPSFEGSTFLNATSPMSGAGSYPAFGAVSLPAACPEIPGYRMQRLIGSGATGSVYLALQEKSGKNVAIKLLRMEHATSDLVRRFSQEGRLLRLLSHPCLARLIDSGSVGEEFGAPIPFLVMDFVEGKTITKYCVEAALGLRNRVRLFMRLCEGVAYLHRQGVVHRDLKPGNILVDRDAEVKILDFGLARVLNSDIGAATMHTADGMVLGSLNYMSPEQARGDAERIDARSDIYSLGVIGYAMVAGRLPVNLRGRPVYDALNAILTVEPPPVRTHLPECGEALEAVLARALVKRVEDRIQSAAELVEELRACPEISGEPGV